MMSVARLAARRTFMHPPRRQMKCTSIRSFATTSTGEAPKRISFSQNEFPDREESPIVTRNSSVNLQIKPNTNTPFPYTVPKSRRIGLTRPANIPENLPLESLEVPETKITTLSNGVRVGSMETFSQVSTLGVVLDYGSRYESDSILDPKTNAPISTAGVNHMMELLAFQSTKHHDGFQIQNIMEKLGGVTFATSSREQFIYGVDVLRPNAIEAFNLLGETVNSPMVYEEELEQMKQVIEFQLMDVDPRILLGEGLQIAGYGETDGKLQQLGRPHFCKSNYIDCFKY